MFAWKLFKQSPVDQRQSFFQFLAMPNEAICVHQIPWKINLLSRKISFGSWFQMSQTMASWPDAFGRMVFWRTHLMVEQQWNRSERTWVPLSPSKAALMVQIISTKLLLLTPVYSTNSLQCYGVGTQTSVHRPLEDIQV